MFTLGWDLGGAHVKAALLAPNSTSVLAVWQESSPLWQGTAHLNRALERIATSAFEQLGGLAAGVPLRHAVTMTGECVDAFADRASGVREIITLTDPLLSANSQPVHYYAGKLGFLSRAAAIGEPAPVASANWYASASWVAKHFGNSGLFVDIGSTTCDVLAYDGGQVLARGHDDFGRLASGELRYTGLLRTPLMALTPRVQFDGQSLPLMAESFATTADVYRLLDQLNETLDLYPAADQGEKTVAGSARRLARMIGRDAASAPLAHWQALAQQFASAQRDQVLESIAQVCAAQSRFSPQQMVLVGAGAAIAQSCAQVLGLPVRSAASLLHSPRVAAQMLEVVLPAIAVAALLAEVP